MSHYDVIIIGAGPGGLQCARELSGSNLNVLLIERKATIGPKICAGGITGYDIDVLQIPKQELAHAFKSVDFVVNGKKIETGLDREFLFSIGRYDLGQWQLKQITGKNIEIRTSCRVVKIKEDTVELDTGESITYRYLVGADGATSTVRKHLGLKAGQTFATFQYEIAKVYPRMQFHLDAELFGLGYAWVFPQKNSTLIGCGCEPKYYSANLLKTGFEKWLTQNKIQHSGDTRQSFPIRVEYQGWKFGNVFLIGEATGLVSPATGEGIYMALVSGQETARKILNPDHPEAAMNQLIRKWKRHKLYFEVFVRSGKFRKYTYGLLLRLASSKYIQRKLLERYLPEFYN